MRAFCFVNIFIMFFDGNIKGRIAAGSIRNLVIGGEFIREVTDVDSKTVGEASEGAMMLYPGFIDIHIHGAAGIDVNSTDADGLFAIARYLATQGVTAWMPTLVPDSSENYRRTIRAIDLLMEYQESLPVAQAVGVHYEGIFANEKMCGALRPEYFRKFSGKELESVPRLRRGVHMMTLAPEIDGGIDLVRELRRQGWVVSIGHTAAEPTMLDTAFSAGARHLTHFFNAMTGIHHRSIGVAGWTLGNNEVSFDIIADGIHVHPKMLELACRAKGASNVMLISDSIAPTGQGAGEFSLWGENIRVENGRTENERGSIAGSVITLLDAVKMMKSLGFEPTEIEQMSSANAARLLGLSETLGSLDPGKRADIVAIDNRGNPAVVVIGGRVITP